MKQNTLSDYEGTDSQPNRETLQRLYWDEGLSQSEIADRYDVTQSAVYKWMKKHDIKQYSGNQNAAFDYQDKGVLEEFYIDKGLSMAEIAEKAGVAQATIRRWLINNSIEIRSLSEGQRLSKRRESVPFYTNMRGYEVWIDNHGEKRDVVRVHRLVAVAEYGFSAVVNNVVHHHSNIPWDNRPGNIEPMDRAMHTDLHNKLD